jgi:hypothetical protein
MMMTPDLPDPPFDLDISDPDELELAPSESPPPSCTPSADFSRMFSFRAQLMFSSKFTRLTEGSE